MIKNEVREGAVTDKYNFRPITINKTGTEKNYKKKSVINLPVDFASEFYKGFWQCHMIMKIHITYVGLY